MHHVESRQSSRTRANFFHRLVGANKNNGAAVFSCVYDRFGNRWQQNGPNSMQLTFTGNNPGNPQNNNRIDGYSYDAAGNLLNDGVHSYAYNAENRITSVDAGSTATYLYDARNHAVTKTIFATDSQGEFAGSWDFLYDQSDRLITETAGNGSGALWRSEVFAGSRHLETSWDGNQYIDHADHLGTERARFDTNYSTWSTSTGLPFGDATQWNTSYGISQSAINFTGQRRDSETGLDNFGARYYGSSLGRFMSADPFTVTPGRVVDPQQLNLYAYVRNNPLKHIDPTGMLIDDAACKQDQKHCGKDWQKVQDIANQKDKNGNYTHPELHKTLESLQNDSRTFVIENSKLGAGTAGLFTITNFTADGKDFTRATLQLDFKQIKGISGVTGADLVPGFNKYQGLLDSPIYRLAETFGHEGAHGVFGIQNPAQAVGIQQLLNQRDAAMQGQHYPYPPDVMQKMQQADQALIPTERFAQQVEKIINGELQADKKKQ